MLLRTFEGHLDLIFREASESKEKAATRKSAELVKMVYKCATVRAIEEKRAKKAALAGNAQDRADTPVPKDQTKGQTD